MKKLLAALLTIGLAFSLVGCSKSDNNQASSGDKKEVNIGVAIYQFNDNFMTNYREQITKYFDELNAQSDDVVYKVQIVDGANDLNTQTEQVKTFIANQVDGLIVNLVQTSSDALAQEIVDSGIPCVFINREIADFAYTDKTCYVGADARDSGTYQGQIIYDQENHGDINGNGTIDYVMIMGDPENSDAQFRTEYSIKYLTDNGATVNKLYEGTGNWDQTNGQEIAAAQLSALTDQIDVIFCNNDAMALGAYQAIKAAGRVVGEDIYLVGVDALDEAVQMVADGTLTGTVLNDCVGQATACCDTLIGLLDGTQPKDVVNYVPYVMVTSDNVDEYLK